MGKNDMTAECCGGFINIRAGAIIMKDGKILMVGNPDTDYLYSVGGRLKFGETAEEAVVREVLEETGVKMEVDRLGFVHELYFLGDSAYNLGKTVYEISYYFYMKPPDGFDPSSLSFTEDGTKEYLTWVSLDDPVKMYPRFFKTELKHPENTVKFYTFDDRGGVWEKLWGSADDEKLFSYLKKYDKYDGEEIAFFKEAGVKTVCDAACGFGAYTLALASNGFEVSAFDISTRAAAKAKEGLRRFGHDVDVKSADILGTRYADGYFDGVCAVSVLDHMTKADAEKALCELYRIARPGGLIMLAFDKPDETGLTKEHEILPDGSIKYENGMIFHPYDSEEIAGLTVGRETVFECENGRGEQIVILKR